VDGVWALVNHSSHTLKDLKASGAAICSMDFSYQGQDRYELALLTSLIDKDEAQRILSDRYPGPSACAQADRSADDYSLGGTEGAAYIR
jgi:hypothetical protein